MTDRDIRSLLDEAFAVLEDSSETARLDAEILLSHCLGKPRSHLRAWPEKIVVQAQQQDFMAALEQRRLGIPIAYIVGKREFWSRDFEVSPAVLIPRPDTELLIDLSLRLIASDRPCKLIDLGTGSGIIAITLAAERPLAEVVASDISEAALQVARGNAERYRLTNIRFLCSNWFQAVADEDFDLVLSNPPYIAADDPHLQQGDIRHEPPGALVAAEQGLRDIRTLALEAGSHLKANGRLLIEHGYNQQRAVQAVFHRCGYREIETHCDLAGNPRVTTGVWNP